MALSVIKMIHPVMIIVACAHIMVGFRRSWAVNLKLNQEG